MINKNIRQIAQDLRKRTEIKNLDLYLYFFMQIPKFLI